MAFLYLMCFWLMRTTVASNRIGDYELVHEWKLLEFEWPSNHHRVEAIAHGTYIPYRNLIAGIKVYEGCVYVTIPRWFWTSGHPVTLAKVVRVKGQDKLRPYPTWAAQKQGDCNALQNVQSMEVDHNTGLMYVLDTGRVGQQLNLCPAKIVVYDLNTDSEVQIYELPADVASPTHNILNDIVLDYVDGKVRFVYITDSKDARLVVFDLQTRTGVTVKHPTMGLEENGAENIKINGQNYIFPVALDGIAISPDFRYVYYCSLAGFNLYQVPTSSLRLGRSDGVRLVGKKVSQSAGINYGSKHLFYGAMGLNAVFFWDSDEDMANQNAGIDTVTLRTETQLVRNDREMQWPDTLAFDNQGWIWFVSNCLHKFLEANGIPENQEASMRIWKVFVNESGYLGKADSEILTSDDDQWWT